MGEIEDLEKQLEDLKRQREKEQRIGDRQFKVWNPMTFPVAYSFLQNAVSKAVEWALEHGNESTVTIEELIREEEWQTVTKVAIIRGSKIQPSGLPKRS